MARRWTKLPNIFVKDMHFDPSLANTSLCICTQCCCLWKDLWTLEALHFHLTAQVYEVQSLPCCCCPYCTVTFISCMDLLQIPHEFSFTPPHCLFFYHICVIISYNAACWYSLPQKHTHWNPPSWFLNQIRTLWYFIYYHVLWIKTKKVNKVGACANSTGDYL
jgi:hypothetical protein